MKYMSYIFENQDLRQTVANNEVLVDMASSNVINYNIALESYIYENLALFTSASNDIVEIYENVRDFIINENTTMYSQLSEILADTELSMQEKAYCLQEAAPGGASIAAATDMTLNVPTAVKGQLPTGANSIPAQQPSGSTVNPLSGGAETLNGQNPVHTPDQSAAQAVGFMHQAKRMAYNAQEALKHKRDQAEAGISHAYGVARENAHQAYDAASAHVAAHPGAYGAGAGALGALAAGGAAYGAYKLYKKHHKK